MAIGDCIFWADDDGCGIERAREFAKSRGLNADDVRIVRKRADTLDCNMIMVLTKRDKVAMKFEGSKR